MTLMENNTHLDITTQNAINKWLNEPFDQESKNQIRQWIEAEAWEILTDAFYRDLEFGTGGMRGVMGVGSNRINIYTLAAATQGLSNFLLRTYPNEPISVALTHDSRNNAVTFADIVADVFSANGIKVYYFTNLRPTPELSFAIRELNCKSGVMLTASHNPKEYSGYKVYREDGCQIIAPQDKEIVSEVLRIQSLNQINFQRNPELIERIGHEMDEKYMQAVCALALRPTSIKKQKDLSIVFSPIHGTAVTIVPETLRRLGFENVSVVEAQCTIDGNFPTVIYPNPEEKEALQMAIDQALQENAELVMATDPDADRVGIAVRKPNDEFVLLNGNQTGVLLFYYMLSARKELNLQTAHDYIVKTIVTTQLLDKMAADFGIQCYNVLTGFKYIGSLMTEKMGKENFIVGAEESYGYLTGTHARDKDAVAACAMIAEMAAYYKDNGKTLYQVLMEIYQTFGYFKEDLISLTLKGKKGAETIQKMMENFRTHPPKSLGEETITQILDYQTGLAWSPINQVTEKIKTPSSNVLQFVTEKGSVISVRPSGTEPKIKFYVSVNQRIAPSQSIEEVEAQLDKVILQMKNELTNVE